MSNAHLRFSGILFVTVFLAAALFAPSAKAQIYWCPDVPAGWNDEIAIAVPDAVTISNVKVMLSGSIRDYSYGSTLSVSLSNGSATTCFLQVPSSSGSTPYALFDDVIFTDSLKQESEAKSEKTTISGPFATPALADFVGENSQATWTLVLESNGINSTANITSFGLAFNTELPNCSLSVPWYVDNASVNTGLPPSENKTTSIVYLHNNLETEMIAYITYYTSSGVNIGPWVNNFTIAPSSTIAFRPVADDPNTPETPMGQEDPATGALVPNRPMAGEGNDGKKNGSLVVRWHGNPTDVQGMVKTWSKSYAGITCDSFTLPPGATQD